MNYHILKLAISVLLTTLNLSIVACEKAKLDPNDYAELIIDIASNTCRICNNTTQHDVSAISDRIFRTFHINCYEKVESTLEPIEKIFYILPQIQRTFTWKNKVFTNFRQEAQDKLQTTSLLAIQDHPNGADCINFLLCSALNKLIKEELGLHMEQLAKDHKNLPYYAIARQQALIKDLTACQEFNATMKTWIIDTQMKLINKICFGQESK